MIKIYAAPRTRAFRILWLLEEIGQPYELEMVDFKPTSDQFFIQDTPTGKIPTLEDGETVICESGAIMQYILDHNSAHQLEPSPHDPARALYLQWFHYAESSAFGPLGNIVWLTQYRDDYKEHKDLIVDAGHRAKTALSFIETRIGDQDYLAGDSFTAADIMMGFTLLAASTLGVLGPDFPNLQAYLGRLAARPAFRTALAKLS